MENYTPVSNLNFICFKQLVLKQSPDYDIQDMVLFVVFYVLVIVNIALSSFTEKGVSKKMSEEDANDVVNQSFEMDGKTPLVLFSL